MMEHRWPLQVRAVIPRRSSLAGDRGVLVVNYAMHKQKTLFFFLLQARALCWRPAALRVSPVVL